MHTVNRITMRATPEVVYALASDISRWPSLLPHYRYVRTADLSPRSRRAKMGAYRTGIPVSWTSTQELNPDERTIMYHHIGGVTKGMDVRWSIRPVDDGQEVTIDHWLDRPVLILRPPMLREIVGRLFVKHIAEKTLRGLKAHAEGFTEKSRS